MMQKKKSYGKMILIWVSGIALLCGVWPFFFGNYNAGAVGCLGFGGALLALTLLWNRFQDQDGKPALWWRRIRMLAAAGMIAATVAGTTLSALMVKAALFTPPVGDHTVIILGCQVRGEEPSLMLKYRLDAAYKYLADHPEASVVCAGGLGQGSVMSEAAVMQKYLLSKGISRERIYLEDQSTNTEENIQFSAQIIQAQKLPESVAIATDSFHEYRGALYARRSGLNPAAIPGKSPWGLFPSYWVREWFGILKMVLIR